MPIDFSQQPWAGYSADDQQMLLQSQMDPGDAAGFGPGTPQYAAYREMIDRGQYLVDHSNDGMFGSATDAFKLAALSAVGAGFAGGAFGAAGASGSGAAGLTGVNYAGTYLPAVAGGGGAAAAGAAGAGAAAAGGGAASGIGGALGGTSMWSNIPAFVGAFSSLLGAKQQGDAISDAANAARQPFGSSIFAGAGGLTAQAGQGGYGYDLGSLNGVFDQQAGLAGQAGGLASNALRNGVPQGVQDAANAFTGLPMNLGTLNLGEGGANALSLKSLADAFNPNNTIQNISGQALAQLRAQAAPQEQRALQSFQNSLYSTGRGAVTGARGSEDTLGGGALAAAFARGQGQSDLDRQVQAQQFGISGANAQSNLLTQAFGRYGDATNLASGLNTASYNRQYTGAQSNLGVQQNLAGFPAQLAAAFQNLAGSGIGQAGNLNTMGLNAALGALNNQTAVSGAQRGTATNLSNLAINTSASPLLDAFGTLGASMSPPNAWQNLFKKTPQPVGTVPGPNDPTYGW